MKKNKASAAVHFSRKRKSKECFLDPPLSQVTQCALARLVTAAGGRGWCALGALQTNWALMRGVTRHQQGACYGE